MDDFEGFSPSQMSSLLYDPFGPSSGIGITNNLSKNILLKIPAFEIALEIFKAVHENEGIKPTKTGNLPVKIIKNIYNKRILPENDIEKGYSKLRTETEWISLHSIAIVLRTAGMTRILRNKLLLNSQISRLIDSGDYFSIFMDFIKVFTQKFNWAYNDRYPNENSGQLGFMYLIFLLHKYGHEKRDLKFYTDLYYKAFPTLWELDPSFGPDSIYDRNDRVVFVRFFLRFAVWFGLVRIEDVKEEKYNIRNFLTKTPLLDDLITVRV